MTRGYHLAALVAKLVVRKEVIEMVLEHTSITNSKETLCHSRGPNMDVCLRAVTHTNVRER